MRHRHHRLPLRRAATIHPERTAVAVTLASWALTTWSPIPVLALIGAMPLVFWLPGASLFRLVKSTRSGMAAPERAVRPSASGASGQSLLDRSAKDVTPAAMATALSAALAILVGLALALTTKHLSRVLFSTIVAGMAVTFSLATLGMSTTAGRPGPALAQDGDRYEWRSRRILLTVATCCVLGGLLGYLSYRLYETPPPSSTYAALSLDHQGDQTSLVVNNREATTIRFQLEVFRNDETIAKRTFSLSAGAKYELELPARVEANSSTRYVAQLTAVPGNQLVRQLFF